MIYSTDGRPLGEALVDARVKALQRRPLPRNWLMRSSPNGGFERAYRTLRDKLGDVYRVYSEGYRHRGKYTGEVLRKLRAERGVGRPVGSAHGLTVEKLIIARRLMGIE